MNKNYGSHDLKRRVMSAKENLPSGGITSVFFHYFKEVEDTKKNRSRLGNVLHLRVADEEITEKLEQLVKLLKK